MEERNLDVQYNLFADANGRRGVYSNLAAVKTVNNEVIIDFALVDEIGERDGMEARDGILVSRVIMTSNEAKSLADALMRHVSKHFPEDEK